MKNKFKLLAVAAAAASALGATSVQAQGVEFHGYLRTQVGTTSEGGNLQCFQGGWPIRAKYRLGNECDNYGEAMVVAPFGKADGAWAKYSLMLALQERGAQDYESTATNVDFANSRSSQGFQLASRQNFVQAGGFFGDKGAFADAKIWIGKRYYNRHDIHINDYFYWNNSGPGAGIEDIAAGPLKLAFAYHQNGGNGSVQDQTGNNNGNAKDDVVAKRYAMRFYDINVNPNGKLEGELVLLKGSTASDTASTGSGTMLFLEHTQTGVLGGFNKFAFVYGNKLGSGFEWLPTYPGATEGDEGKNSWRIHDQFYFDLAGTNVSGMLTGSYGKVKTNSGNSNTWTSFGIRPQYNFTDNFSLAAEVGYDTGKTDSGAKPKLAKLTIAPQLSLAKGFWARPVFRAFVTYAKWNDDAGTQANGVFGDKRNGMTYGVQVESWW
ncbi:MAG: carbohydrate porin [Cytophagales bacterium]|nr:carbohydrate porin [Rhizobacter sp.]